VDVAEALPLPRLSFKPPSQRLFFFFFSLPVACKRESFEQLMSKNEVPKLASGEAADSEGDSEGQAF